VQALMSYPTLRADRAAVVWPPLAVHGAQRLPLTRQQFEAWLRQAAPGDRLVYHRGYLAVDRARGSTRLSEPDRRELGAVAKAALILAERGEIHLIQRRVEPGDFSYLAVKSRPDSGSR
jgi:hypothetical protein